MSSLGAWFWIQIGSLKDISSHLVNDLALVFPRSEVLEKRREISARLTNTLMWSFVIVCAAYCITIEPIYVVLDTNRMSEG